MRLLERNKQTVYWRNLTGTTAITATDEDGNTLETGEYKKTYGEVKSARVYVKSAIGMNNAEPFGDFTAKQRTIYAEIGATDIDEYSILWVGIDPQVVPEPEPEPEPVPEPEPEDLEEAEDEEEQDNEEPLVPGEPTVPHNYTVDGISHGLNHIRIAIRQVDVK